MANEEWYLVEKDEKMFALVILGGCSVEKPQEDQHQEEEQLHSDPLDREGPPPHGVD